MLFSSLLLDWYEENKRDLPWRKTRDPYIILLSEVILQQTRIAQGMEYYKRFVERFPTIASMAAAKEEDVLKLWQGLGYYSRARNLYAAVQSIQNEHNGRFPSSYQKVLKLKGVGKYTAAAIMSFAYNEPLPVVDGNVYRFLSRLKGIYTPINTSAAYDEFELVLKKEIDRAYPALFNQALMDFGSLVCKPQNPSCQDCIFQSQCYAFASDKILFLPVKKKLKSVRIRYFYYLLVRFEQKGEPLLLLHKRTDKDIWEHLYEFPLIENSALLREEQLYEAIQDFLFSLQIFHFDIRQRQEVPKHQLSHQTLLSSFIEIEVHSFPPSQVLPANYYSVEEKDLTSYPIPILIDKYLKKSLKN